MFPAAVGPVLWRPDKHFHKVVVQRIVKLPLKTPLELGVVEVAGMEIEIVGVHRDGSVFELNDELNSLALGARGKVQKRMLVEFKLSEDSIEASSGGFGHYGIVKQVEARPLYS